MKKIEMPRMIYGTAWKEEATGELVKTAAKAGFRAFDTANQKKHYREDYAGEALLALRKEGIMREDLFLQSKYTYEHGQDHRLPYDPADELSKQVRDSFENSLKNLHTDYLDSYLLHGPSAPHGLTEDDWEVWGAIEKLYESGQAKRIGVSNVSIHHLKALCDDERVKVKPQIVQNRCYANRGWDQTVREYCLSHGIVYEGFSLLTANVPVLSDAWVLAIANRLKVTPPQVIFRFSMQIGILPLTGTTDPEHMKEDLAVTQDDAFELSADEIRMIAGAR